MKYICLKPSTAGLRNQIIEVSVERARQLMARGLIAPVVTQHIPDLEIPEDFADPDNSPDQTQDDEPDQTQDLQPEMETKELGQDEDEPEAEGESETPTKRRRRRGSNK